MTGWSPTLRGLPPAEYTGFCRPCAAPHRWTNDVALGAQALATLFTALSREAQFRDLHAALEASSGKMVGVMVAEDGRGQRQVLRALSGDLGRRDAWPGWVPSVMERAATADLEGQTLRVLSALEAELATPGLPDDAVRRIKAARRASSATLMAAMFDAATLCSMAGIHRPLREVFVGRGIPSGSTECAVPKLLHHANRERLRPLALAEAWWGQPLQERRHGDLQTPCAAKCQPILGYLLCGAG